MGMIIGIDPGLSGAVARIDDDLDFLQVNDTPTMTVKSGPKLKRRYQVPAMVELLRGNVDFVMIENVHSMPGQGVASSFSFGYGLGLWIGIIAGLEIPYEMVTPQRWKGVMMDGQGREKDAARYRAQQLFPSIALQFARKKDDGRAEAMLIAEYARRMTR
jgi:crossover junction endodeoxyribonuclease RuvC